MSFWDRLPVIGSFTQGDLPRVKERTLGANGRQVRDAAGNIVRTAGQRTSAPVGDVRIDQSQQNDFRNRSLALANSLADVASGKGPPSVAEQQALKTQDSNFRQMRAAQASNRGGAGPSAASDILDRENLAQNDAAGTNAVLRAQEVATARGQLGDIVTAGRGQDINLATSQAQIDLQRRMADRENELRSRGLNDQAIKDALAQEFQVDVTNLNAGLTADQINSGIDAQNAANTAAIRSNLSQGLSGIINSSSKGGGSGGGVSASDAASLAALASDKNAKMPIERPEELSRERKKPSDVMSRREELSRDRKKQTKGSEWPFPTPLPAPKMNDQALTSDKKSKRAAALKKSVDSLSSRAEWNARSVTKTNPDDAMDFGERAAARKKQDAVDEASSKASDAARSDKKRDVAQSMEPSLRVDQSLPVPYDTRDYQGSEFIKSDKAAKEAAYKQGVIDASGQPAHPSDLMPGRPMSAEQIKNAESLSKKTERERAAQEKYGLKEAPWQIATRGMDPNSLLYARTLDRVQGTDGVYENSWKRTFAPELVDTSGTSKQSAPPPKRRVLPGETAKDASDIASDSSAKMSRDGKKKADALLAAMKPVSYQYKDKRDGQGEWLGIFAQDLEKGGSPGKSMVSKDERGTKVVDTKKLTSALAAAVARLEQTKADKKRKG